MQYRKTVLSNLAEYINGFAFKPSDWKKEGTKIIRIEQLNNPKGQYDYYSGIVPNCNSINNEDLIFSWSATLKVVIWKYGKGVLNQHLFKVVPYTNTNKYFLFHLLDYNMKKLSESSHGSTMKHIKREELDKYTVSIPKDTKEQEKIAQILSTCDSVIEKTEETIEKYKQIKAGMMQDLFTRGLDKNGKLRPTYEQSPDLYKYSEELDRYIPKEWDVDKLEADNVAIINPACGKLPDEFIYIDLESVINGNIEQTKIISRIGAPSRAQRLVENYDILYQTVRPYQKNNYLYIQTTNMRSVASTGYAQIRTVLNPLFLYQYLHTDLFVNKVLCNCTGTSYPAINPTNLGKIYIPIPKDDEQKIIANLFKTIDIKINNENEVLSKYKQIKQGLMKKLLTPPADAEIVEE